MILRSRLPVLILLVSVLLLRALVPVGWMPMPGNGALAIEPCPAAGAAPMIMAPGRAATHHHRANKDNHGGDCAFAPFHAAFGPPADGSPLNWPITVVTARRDYSGTPALATGAPALPPPSTGPPSIA